MEKKRNFLLALAATLIYGLVFSLLLDCYYYVNDDFIIRDILSGRYSGVADAHVYNVIYPFAYLLKVCYQTFPTVDFWAILLAGLPYVSMFAVLYRVLQLSGKKVPLAILCVYLVYTCVALYQICYFTFTFTGTICAATGLFLFVTEPQSDWRFSRYIVPLTFFLLAFCIRKDTLFMLMPLVGSWAVFLVVKADNSKAMCLNLLRPVTALGLSCALLWCAHVLAFAGDDWQEYFEFRNARKAVHDFSGYPGYESAPELYDELGLSYYEYKVAGTTGHGGSNTVLDYSADIVTILQSVGEYVQIQKDARSPVQKVTDAVAKIYGTAKSGSRGVSAIFAGWNGILAVFVGVVLLAVFIKRKQFVLLITFIGGLVLIGFEVFMLAYIGRVTSAVLLCEINLVLIWVCCIATYTIWNTTIMENMCGVNLLIIGVLAFGLLVSGKWVDKAFLYQDFFLERHNTAESIRTYCKEHPENAYFQPAIAISPHSFKLGTPFDCAFNNLVITGGWNATSPEYMQSLTALGIQSENVEKAILTEDNVYVVSGEEYVSDMMVYFDWKYEQAFTWKIVDQIEISDETTVNVYDFSLETK